MIIGCDYHPAFQQIGFVDTDTGAPKNAKKVSGKGSRLRESDWTAFLSDLEFGIQGAEAEAQAKAPSSV